MTQPKAVVFDIGNVLIEWQPERYFDRRIGEAGRRALFAEVDLHGMNERIDAGARFRDTVYETAEDHPQWTEQIRWWFDDWIALASPRIDRSIRLLRALRGRDVPVFALTNFGDDSFAYACTQYKFLTEFDRAYVSGRMGVTKPSPQIYAMLEEDCGLPPAALLFTDDRPENIEAAAARGWGVHHFTGAEGWARALVHAGLLNEAEAA